MPAFIWGTGSGRSGGAAKWSCLALIHQMSPGTHIKLLLNRLCIRTQTEEKEHSQTPTAPTAAPPPPLLPSPFHPSYAPCSEEE